MRVMVVDDVDDIVALLIYRLERLGHEGVAWAEDFSALLTLSPWEDIEVAIVDASLGEATLDGLDILAFLAVERPDIWRVLHTGYSPEVLGDRCRWAQAVLDKGDSLEDALMRS